MNTIASSQAVIEVAKDVLARFKKQPILHFTALVFCGLLIFNHNLFAADSVQNELGMYEYQTIKILPGSVTSNGWAGAEHVLSQEMTDDSLFGNFDNNNSARVVKVEPALLVPVVDQIDTTPTSSEVTPENETPTTPDAGGVVSEPTPADAITPIEGAAPVEGAQQEPASEMPVEPEPAPEAPVEPEPQPAPEPDTSADSSLEALSKSFFQFTNIVTALLPLANETFVTETVEQPPVEVITPEPVVEDTAPVVDEVPQEETVPPVEEVVNPTPVEQPVVDEATPPLPEVVEEQTPSEPAPLADTVTQCTDPCTAHTIELGDFTVLGDETQQITNMQLRVSLAARPHAQVDATHERIKIEYLHYDYWIDGGVIELTDEVSNAINGGYFLFGFPLYSEWEEMSRIKVRLTYESDNEHLSDILVDSVWLEVESIDHNAFNDSNPAPIIDPAADEEVLRTAPSDYYFDLMSEKTEFTHDEMPRFVFDIQHHAADPGFFERIGDRIMSFLGFEDAGKGKNGERVRMRVVDDEFEDIAHVEEKEDGSYELDIPKMRQFTPGRHVVTVEVTDGDSVFYVDQEFMWGVLALNADKTIYMNGEEAYLQMGTIDDRGHTICDAKLDLEIVSPQGTVTYLSTNDGSIEYGTECAGDSYTTSPDYSAHYTFTDGVGAYSLRLTATTDAGTHTTTDTVEVRDTVPFDIVRTGPTRIYPVEPYPVTLTVTANEDFEGAIVESVPVSFQVYERGGTSFRTHEEGDAKQLMWDVSLTKGETIELSYRFDAPDTSPEYYLLGPLSIGTFAEIREWQIASDAPSNATIVQSAISADVTGTTYSATFGSAPTPGNLIIMVAANSDGASAFNAPAAYLTQVVLSNATVELDIGMWYAQANSASTTYSISKTGGNQTGIVALYEVSGLNTSNPVNVTGSNDQTGSNSRVAYTGATGVSTQFGFALAAVSFGDNDFNNPTTASWASDSLNTYTQRSWSEFAAGNDLSLGLATANINIADTQGATLTVTGGGSTEQRNSIVAVFNLAPQTNTVGARGNQESQMKVNTTNNYVGGAFTISTNNGTTSVTSITISEAGTTDASVDLSNIRLKYELDSVAPYDCASVSYDGTEAQYGATSTAFSSANGTSTFTGAVTISTTSALCLYTVLNVDASATVGHTLELQITNPSTQVVTGTGSSSPATVVALSDTTTLTIGYSPDAPALADTPAFSSMRATTTQPTFGGFASIDADGDNVEYEFSIDDDPLFASPATTTSSFNYPGDAGWTAATFASGATTTYRIQQALTPGTTYWWRVRARDPLNTNVWGDYSSIRSITIGSDLSIPEWFETTNLQFASSTTFTNATTSGNGVQISNLDTSVSLLNTWSTGNTKTISSGSDRLLVVAVISEDSATSVNVNTVTYGGQTLTEITDQQIGTGFSNGLWLGYLKEAQIRNAVGSTIVPTWTGGTPDNGIQYASAVFSGVHQTSPVRDYSPNALTAGTTITPASAISVLDGDFAFYIAESATGLTHTPSTGYTEGTEQDSGGSGFVSASAYKAITADGSEYPTATWSASGNRLLMVAASLQPAPGEAVIMSDPIDFNWVSNQNDWGEITWHTTETDAEDTRLRVYYGTSTDCSTIIPDAALAGNSNGFAPTTSPITISSLATSTTLYNRICLQMTLSEGTATTSPTFLDWAVSWEPSPFFDQTIYHWYANTASATPADAWPPGSGGTTLGEDEPITTAWPVSYGDTLRLRMGLEVSTVAASNKSFKLQYAEGGTCGPNMNWTDVAPIGSSTALWRGYNNAGLTDGATLSATVLTNSDTLETYEEENSSAPMPNTIIVGNQGEWDWVLESQASAGTAYCFRMATADGNPLASHTVYPALITNEAPSVISMTVPFDNEAIASTTPWFEFMALDTEADPIDYEIQIDNDVTFASTIVDTDSGTNLVDFQNIDTPADKSPFNESETIRFTSPVSFTNGNTYWWRVRAIDADGSNQYGEWSTAQSFTVNTGVTIATWFQTTEEQFDTDTLQGTDATASDWVAFASGSTTGTTTSSSIDFDSGRTGNAWGVFSFAETGAANDILYHIEYYTGTDWALVPDTDLPSNSTGFDTSPVNLIDLDTETYNTIRIRANFRAGTPTLTDWTVTWGQRVSVPTHLLLFDNEKVGTTTPTFTFYTTDPQGDALQYEFSWSTDNTFATGSTTVNSSTSPGFVNVNNGADTNPFDSGGTIRYSMQTGLTNGNTYWWRVRAKDPLGGNNFSFWSNPWSFTVDTTATTSTWFQTTQEQFDTDTLLSLEASAADSVSTIPAGVTTYNFAGVTNPSSGNVARYFRIAVNDPTTPPTVDEIDTITTSGTAAGSPNLRTAIAGHSTDAEATTAQYTLISSSNNSRWTTTDPGAGYEAVFWAKIHINESAADISQIDLLLEGYQGGAPPVGQEAWFGIWRPGSTTPYWQYLSTSRQTTDTNYTGTITTNISQYLDGNNDIHLIFYNEDTSDPVVVDYVEAVVTRTTADSGTLTGTSLDFNDGSGPAWGQFLWADSEPGLSTISYHLEYLTGAGTWDTIPDSALSGNESGFSTSPITLSGLNTNTYNEIRPVANFACVLLSCPTLDDWTIKWSPGFTISGTAFEYDGISSTTAGTVAVAVNGVLQSGKTGTISNGYWSIQNVTFFDGDVVTVFVNGASDADEAVAATVYDGTPDMPGMRLQKRHLTIGSDDYETVTNANLGLYDYTHDEDLFFDVNAGNDLTMCADTGCGDAGVVTLAGTTYSPGTGADIVTHDFANNGTFIPGSNTVRVGGSWDNNATTTMTGSTVIFTATSTSETIDGTGSSVATFNNVTLGETSGTATWTLGSMLSADGNISLQYGTLARAALPLTIAGNLTIGANGSITGMGTTTFDGINPSTWTDSTAALQNIGRVVVDGTAKTLLLGSNTKAQSMTIGVDDIFDVSTGNRDITIYGDWVNENTFTARAGEVIIAATTTNRTITAGGDAFYDLTFSGVGGAWSFTESVLTVSNDFRVSTGTVTMPTGTTTVVGSWNTSGGTFAHNNAAILFTPLAAETITASGTPFTNSFYTLAVNGPGSVAFVDAYATTSNDLSVTQGTLTLPSANLSVGGSFSQTGGTFTHNSGTVSFTGAGAETIDITSSPFNSLSFTGSGSWSFIDAAITAQGSVWVTGGTLTLPSGTFSVGGSYGNWATVTHNSGTVLFNSTSGSETIHFGSSVLNHVTMNGVGGIWTIDASGTTTGNFTLATTTSFTVASGQTLAVGGTFSNTANGASTTWTGSTLSLEAGNYSINTKTSTGDAYDTLRVKANTDIAMWNSSASTYTVDATGSLYSEDHAGVDGDLYLFGAYERTSGTEHWSYATDFDGTALSTSTARQVDVRFASGASAGFTGSTLAIVGTGAATTTIANQGSGAYTLSVTNGTTTAQYYNFTNLGASGLSLLGTTRVTSLADGRFVPSVPGGTGITIASTTIDTNPGLQVYRVEFSTTTAIAATNVTQTGGAPTSYWWFRESSGNIDGEYFDSDTGDPGSVRWDDSSLTIAVSGTVFSDDGSTPMGATFCDGATNRIRVVVNGGTSYTGPCAPGGTYTISGVVIVGDPILTIYLDTNGGAKGTVVTRTPTADITSLDIYQNRVITRHEDVAPLTILNMAAFDGDNDTDIPYTAATGTLTVFRDTELHIASSTTFDPQGSITIHANASSTSFDGSLHIDDNAVLIGYATSTISLGGSFTMDQGASFTSASTTVVMNATTTGKTITTTSAQEITFTDLFFTGVGGGWNINGDIRSLEDIHVDAGTVTGTGDITVVGGSFMGNGTLSLGSGTTTIQGTNTLGGTTAWTFGNLVLGNGTQVGTTTLGSIATTTILGKLTVNTAHFFSAGGSVVNLAGTGNVLVENGTFIEATSTVRYSGAGATNVLSTGYYNLDLNAQGGSPTYTATGLGIQVAHNMSVGGQGTTTVTFNTNDPALDVNGNVLITTNGTFIGSNSASTTIAGDWDNNGVFTHSSGTVTFDGSGTSNIYAGTSWFGNVTINGAGTYIVQEHATATSAFTLTNAGAFTLTSGQSLAVGGTFGNNISGALTTWTGSTLFLYGGGNYTVNTTAASDTYDTLRVGGTTQVRMWNSNAGTYDVQSTASLYSQDHANVHGDLYIYGAYTKTSGTDYWSYATDFDGSVLGSPRAANVAIASGASVTYTGGGLAVVGTSNGTTTIGNQGSGTYALRIGGTASTTWNYYDLSDMNTSGLTFSGTPNVVSLSYGSIVVSQNSGSGITVGGTVINQNQAKTFTNNYFGTSGSPSPAYNVTATGTTVSSWRFTNHAGTLAGESNDNDPAGDPGYLVWDDSAALITVSGRVYSDEGVTASAACDGSSDIHLRVAGLTSYTTTCNGGDGSYSISNVAFSPNDSIVVYIDGKAQKAATVSVDPVSSIGNMDLYENRVIVRHEGVDPITVADMAVWDSSDDADIPFTAVDGAPDTLTLPADRKLIVWTGKTFAPQGNVTLSGGGAGAAYDGTLELYQSALFDATGSETHSIGGSLITGTGASIDDETSTFTFTTTGAARTIDTNEYPLYNVTLNGTGSWTVTNTALEVGNDLTITQGAITLPSGTTTVTGSLSVTAGSFNANGGTMLFNSSAAETIGAGSSNFSTLLINGTGSFVMQGTNATATRSVTIENGSLTSVGGTFAVGGNFVNDGTFTHNNGTLRLTATTSAVLTASSSDLGGVTFAGGGTYTFTDTSVALLGSLRIESGAVTLVPGTMSIAGSLLNTGGSFDHSSGTILFNSTDTGETINPDGSSFNTVSFASAGGGWTITGNATTTGNFSLVSGTNFTLSSSTRLTVGGMFTNLIGGAATTWTGSTLAINSGVGYTINTKTQGGDVYNTVLIGSSTALRAWDSTGSITMVDADSSLYSQDHAGVSGSLYIYGNYVRGTGTDYWSYATDFDGTALGGSSRQVYVYHASGASTTITGGTLNIVGANGFDTTISNQGSGTYGVDVMGGTLNALYYSFANMGTSGLTLSGETTISSLSEGNFTLAVSGGSLITLASTTLNYNAGLTITGTAFATTTAITGYNVYVVGTTPSVWTFMSHTGNFDGEYFDYDGVDDCGSVRWDDSSCLLTQESAYRWRNDDGGEGVPNSEWYDQNWTKRKRVNVTNADAVAYTNASVKFTVTYDSDMQADFDDLRFTASDGTTLLSHFVETYAATSQAKVWVKIPTLATSTNTTIYMYYGNGSVSDGSATSTFSYLDTFEDGGITEYSGDTSLFAVDGSFAYERSYGLDATGNEGAKATDGIYRTDVTVAQGQTIRYMQYVDTGYGDETCTLFGVQSPGSNNQNYAVCLELYGTDRVSLARDVDYNDTSGVVLASTTLTYATGWYEIEIDWATNNTIGVTVLRDGTVVATTSATNSTYTQGGVGFTFWFQHGGWDIYSSRTLLTTEPTATFGSEQVSGGASWLSSLNTAASGVDIGDSARVRFLIENTGLDVNNQNYEIEFAPKGAAPSCESVNFGDYVEVPNAAACGTSAICMVASSHLTNLEATTDLLGGEGTFTPGQAVEDPSNNTGNVTVLSGEYTEVEYVVTPTVNAADSNYCFRVANEGVDLDSYSRVAELSLRFAPNITSLIFNDSNDITLLPGTTTRVYATGTVSDLNGYADLGTATTTFYQNGLVGGVGYNCTADNNNCYRMTTTGGSCNYVNCAGDSCDIACYADIYYHANPTDSGTYAADTWTAALEVTDLGGSISSTTSYSPDLITLRALSVDNTIDYGALEPTSDTGSYNATTTIENIGNSSLDISLEGTNLSDGGSSAIPVTQQRFATSTFTYSACTVCSSLATTSSNYKLDLSKPASTTPSITDELFWGIAVPFGIAASPHSGTNVFYAIGDF